MFKKVTGFHPFAVSKEGEVQNYVTGNVLKPSLSINGYLRVATTLNGVKYRQSVHRLVAMAFLANPEEKPCVNHKNRKKTDNRVTNLEWCTHAENTRHALYDGAFGKSDNKPITEKDVRVISKLIQDGRRNKDIIESLPHLPITHSYLADLKSGKIWKDVTSSYDFSNSKKGNFSTLSTETIHWVCRCISEGKSNKDIFDLYTGKVLTKSHLHTIRKKKCHTSISDQYF